MQSALHGTVRAFKNACVVGDLKTVQNLFEMVSFENQEYGFELACGHDQLRVAQWMHMMNPDFNASIRAFRYACFSGNLPLVKWLFSEKPDIDISANGEAAFHCACNMGHLNVAEWLISVKPDIDISVYDNMIFQHACCRDNIIIVQFLLSVKPDILFFEDDVWEARYAWQYCLPDLVQLFSRQIIRHSVNPMLSLKKKARDYYVDHAELIRWVRRRYALYMRSRFSETNVFFRVPQDVSRFIIQMFL